MTLLLGATWAYMTPDYIVEDMTWPEISSAIEYIYRYVEPIAASKVAKKYKALAEFIQRGRDTLRDDIKKINRRAGAK